MVGHDNLKLTPWWLHSQVRFPERILTFKVESGSAAERDRWVEALEAARELAQNKAEGQAAHAQSQLGVLQKVRAS